MVIVTRNLETVYNFIQQFSRMSSSSVYQNILFGLLLFIIGITMATRATTKSVPERPHENRLAYILSGRPGQMPVIPPPNVYQKYSSLFKPAMKRSGNTDESYWIWMPAHGYIPVLKEELEDDSLQTEGVNNLLRYGRK